MSDQTVTIRPMRADDVDALRRMFFRLSPETVYRRFFRPVLEPSPRTLSYLANVDHDRREALVAEVDGEIVGVARYDRTESSTMSPGLRSAPASGPTRLDGSAPPTPGNEAEVAIVVEDAWQHHGLGRKLMRALGDVALQRGIDTFTADVLPGNQPAVKLVRKLSPDAAMRIDHGDLVVRAPLSLSVHA